MTMRKFYIKFANEEKQLSPDLYFVIALSHESAAMLALKDTTVNECPQRLFIKEADTEITKEFNFRLYEVVSEAFEEVDRTPKRLKKN